jgi:tRNA A-37 threonylcarbamoyl transferase component Bud32
VLTELRELRLAPAAAPGDLEEAARQAPDADVLLRGLVTGGRLTLYQANEIALGRGRQLNLGNYLLLDKLGQGGMGQVYKALHRHLDRIDAVKVIHADVVTDREAVARFRREARATARLSHPHLVTVHDAGEAEGRHYLAMELIEGADLAKLVARRGPLPAPAVLRMLYQAALGLQHAHERGLVHRDIKPSNLLLSTKGKVKILDLGLASLRGDEMHLTRLTSTYRVMGTPDFIAPEQTVSAAVDGRADLYSLGCTAYFLLAGHVPFPGGDALEKLLRHRLEPARPLEEVRPALQPVLYGVVVRLMAKAPEDRYQTAGDLAEALRPLLAARPATPPSAEKALPANAREQTTIIRRAAATAQSRRWLVFAAAGALLATIVIAVFLWMNNRGPPPDPEAEALTWRAGETFPVAAWSVFGVLFLQDGRRIAVTGGNDGNPANSGSLHLLDTHTGQRSEFSGREGPSLRWLGLTDMGETLVTTSGSGSDPEPDFVRDVTLWSITKRSEEKRWSTGLTKTHAMAVAPGGSWAVLAAPEGKLMKIDLATGSKNWVGPSEGRAIATCLSFSRDGSLLACGGLDGSVLVMETKHWKTVYEYDVPPADRAFLAGLDFRPGDHELVGTGGVPKGRSASIQVWDVENKVRKWSQRHEDRHVFAQALAPNGRIFATGDQAGCVRLWDLKTRARLAEFPGRDSYGPWSLSFSPDGRTLAAGVYDGTVRLFHGQPAP